MKQYDAGREIRSFLTVLATFLALGLPCPAQIPSGQSADTAASAMNLKAYQSELRVIEEAVKSGRDLRQVRRSLPDSWTVTGGKQTYEVPTKEISEALANIERHPRKEAVAPLEARLRAMQQQASELAAGSPGSDTALADAKLKKILARGEFQAAAGPSAWEMVWARIARWIFEHLLRLFRFLNITRKTSNWIAWSVIFLAAVLLFYVVYGWLTEAGKTAEFRAEVEPFDTDARHWLQEALAAADRHNFREAIHCAYWASVAHLEDVRLLPRDRTRTPRESLQLMVERPKEYGLLQGITRSFELIWYGYRPASAGDWVGIKTQLEKMGCLQVSTAPTVPS